MAFKVFYQSFIIILFERVRSVRASFIKQLASRFVIAYLDVLLLFAKVMRQFT